MNNSNEMGYLQSLGYDSFGMITVGRSWEVGSEFRYGFNGKESDSETYGNGNIYDYGFRIYNPRLGKFLSVDPLTSSFPWFTTYQFAGNAPIWAVDLEGLEAGIVIRWYDNTGQWVGTTVLSVQNSNDRPLGQTNYLYMNLPSTQNNTNVISNLRSGISKTNPVNSGDANSLTTFLQNHTQSNTNAVLTDFAGNPIFLTDQTGNFTFNIAFTRIQLSAEDLSLLNNGISRMGVNQSSAGSTIPNTDVIYFDYGSSTFNPNLDPDNNGLNNNDEINQVIAKLNNNPDRVATVTGNASKPNGNANNQNLSINRAISVQNQVVAVGGVNSNQVVNGGGNSSTRASGVNALDQNSTVTYNIPIQSQ